MKLSSIQIFIAIQFSCATMATASEVNQCHTLIENEARLSCYDEATNFEFAGKKEEIVEELAISEQPKIATKWIVREDVSEIDDTKNVYMTLLSNDQILNRYNQSEFMTIYLQCRENTTLFFVHFGGHFMSDYQNGTVTYRLDGEPAQKIRMRESNDNSALGLWRGGSSIPFVKKLFGHETLLIRATPHSESAVTAKFSIQGIEDAVQPLRDSCNW